MSTLPDFVIADEFISQLQNDDILYNESTQVLNCLSQSNFPTERKSADYSTNYYGKQLLEFCQGNDLFIINGRIGHDSIDPKATCTERSTVDYFILKRKSFATLTKMLVPFFGPEQSLSDNAIDKSLHLPCIQHKNQNDVTYGCRAATVILRQPPILKSHGYNTSHFKRKILF